MTRAVPPETDQELIEAALAISAVAGDDLAGFWIQRQVAEALTAIRRAERVGGYSRVDADRGARILASLDVARIALLEAFKTTVDPL